MAFPQIRVNNDEAKKYIRRGVQELFRLHEMQRTSKVPILQNVIDVDEYTTILVQIAKGQEFVDIQHNPPEALTSEDVEYRPPTEGLSTCPPAFILYARKRITGGDEKDYLIAYNRHTRKWQIATVDSYVSASNTGCWYSKKTSIHKTCDIVTWDGQGGGFGDRGYGTWVGDSHGSGFYIGGLKIKGPGGGGACFAAGVFEKGNNDGLRYYTLGRVNEYLHVYEGTLAAPSVQGEIKPVWTLKASYLYSDYGYAGSPHTGNWSPIYGNAFVNSDGVAYFSTVLYKNDIYGALEIMVNHLVSIDMVNGGLKIIHSDVDSMPTQSVHFSDEFDSVTSTMPIGVTGLLPEGYEGCGDQDNGMNGPKPGGMSGGGREESWGGEYTNKDRPMLLRSFGGLDRLYTYELEVDWRANGTFHEIPGAYTLTTGMFHTDALQCIPAFQIPHNVNWHTFAAAMTTTRNEIEEGVATVYCYDRRNGDDHTIVDQLNVWELEYTCNASESWTTVRTPLTEETLWELMGQYTSSTLSVVQPTLQPFSAGPTGSALITVTRRTIIDHHPQIKNSWVYIETKQVINPLSGTFVQKEIAFVDQLTNTRTVVTGYAPTTGNTVATHFDPYGERQFPPVYTVVPALVTGDSTSGSSIPGKHLDWYRNPYSYGVSPSDIFGIYHMGFFEHVYGSYRTFSRAHFQFGISTHRPSVVSVGHARDVATKMGWNGGNDYTAGVLHYGQAAIATDNKGAQTYGAGWNFAGQHTTPYGGGSVAVHREINEGDPKPYIWIKRKVYTDTEDYWFPSIGKSDLYSDIEQPIPHIVGSETSPFDYDTAHPGPNVSWLYTYGGGLQHSDEVIFWTRELGGGPAPPSGKTHFQDMADQGEWFIESNVLSDELILELTGEASLDIYAICII